MQRYQRITIEAMSLKESSQFMTCILFGCIVIHYLVSSSLRAGLDRYPGPFLAKFTRLWHLLDVLSNKHHEHLQELHKRYGEIVRIGPNEISISRSDYVSRVYGLTPGYLKSDMYDAFGPRINGKRAISWLSARDPQDHAAIKKPIAGAYTFSIISEYEPLVDKVIANFVKRLDKEFDAQNGCVYDMAVWMRYYAYDTITQLTFGESLGFLDKSVDVENFMQQSDRNLNLTALLSTMPWAAKIFKYNPIVGYFEKTNTMFPVFSQKQIRKRIAELQDRSPGNPDSTKAPAASRARIFLDRFLEAARIRQATNYDFRLLMEWSLVSIMAGADTTAIGLAAILYYLLKAPDKKKKLLEELHAADLPCPVSWKATQSLPYLDACIKEAFRLHPVIGLGLGRVASGLEMPDGFRLRPGTNVSMNPWVINRQSLFGDDVDSFVPERWLVRPGESQEEFKERLNLWKRSDLFFGGGNRSCTGKYIALLETYKVIPTLLLKLDIELESPLTEWTTINRWTVRQENFLRRIHSK